MRNEIIKTFDNEQFGTIRVVKDDNNEPWFIAKDVCDALEIDSTQTRRLDDDERGVRSVQTLGGIQEMAVISESGLYSLTLGSRKPQAKPFKRWITHDVIPSIRKTGGYVGNDSLFIETYLPFADDNTKLLFKNTLETIRKQNEILEQQKPLVEFANHVTDSADAIDIGELAKLANKENIKIGRNRLFGYLRDNKILMQNNEPYQRYIENKWFKTIETTKQTSYGTKLFVKTLVLGKGQVGIIEMLRKEFGATNE